MNFGTPVTISLNLIRDFVYQAKRKGFAGAEKKTTLTDQSSVYSYRPFESARFAGMIYTDQYNGNTAERGHESVSIDLVTRWSNQYFGGTLEAFLGKDGCVTLKDPDVQSLIAVGGSETPQVVTEFLKSALMRMNEHFPVRGPSKYRATEVLYGGLRFGGDWVYENQWKAVPLHGTCDPFASYIGQERILLNGIQLYWHVYHGGLILDKYFPFVLAEM